MRFFVPVILFAILAAAGYGTAKWVESRSVWRGDDLLPKPVKTDGVDRRDPTQTRHSQPPAQDGLKFIELQNSGLDFTYENGDSGKFHLAETLGGGIGTADLDRDGRTDLIFVDGGDPINWPDQISNSIHIYRHLSTTSFTEVGEQNGCLWSGYGHGCCLGDFNNDGFDDFLITGYQSTAFFMNMGDGTYEERTEEAGLKMDRWCATAAFGDLDNDGDLDLYVTTYANTPRDVPPPYCEESGRRIHCHPHYYSAVPDYLFENVGDGTFRDRSTDSGISEQIQYGLGVVIADFNDDRTPEIFIANDGDRNLLFEKESDWKYREIGIESGVAYTAMGKSTGSMGIACADFNRDGRLDLLTTNFIHETNVTFYNQGGNTFVDTAGQNGLSTTSRAMVGWSAVPFDADLDGRPDLFVTNGHVTDSPSASFQQPPLLFHGTNDSQWKKTENAGAYFEQSWHGRGALATDLNEDGLPDLVVSPIDDPATILLNDFKFDGPVTTLQFVGTDSNRSAGNLRIEVQSGSETNVHERQLSGGYLTSRTTELSFASSNDGVNITLRWPNGNVQEMKDLSAGSYLIIEGKDEPLSLKTD